MHRSLQSRDRYLTVCCHVLSESEFGAWYPRFNIWTMHRPWERYRRDIWDLFDLRLRHTSARVLWRAYGPTHFGGPTGTFTGASFFGALYRWHQACREMMHMCRGNALPEKPMPR